MFMITGLELPLELPEGSNHSTEPLYKLDGILNSNFEPCCTVTLFAVVNEALSLILYCVVPFKSGLDGLTVSVSGIVFVG